MSRYCRSQGPIRNPACGLAAATVLGLPFAGGAAAQEVPARSAETVFEQAAIAYTPPPEEPACEASGDEDVIVICAQRQEQSQFRSMSTAQLDPTSKQALDDGLPRGPDVAGPGIFHGPGTGSFGGPPPPALIVDVTALPAAPPGSDADRIARGLAPKGE